MNAETIEILDEEIDNISCAIDDALAARKRENFNRKVSLDKSIAFVDALIWARSNLINRRFGVENV